MKGMENIDPSPIEDLSQKIWQLIESEKIIDNFSWGSVTAVCVQLALRIGLKKEALIHIIGHSYDMQNKKRQDKDEKSCNDWEC
jgi:hypothetical protein